MSAIDFVEECYVGSTVRVYAKDLCDIDGGLITSGAVVTIDRYDPDGALGEAGTVVNEAADWYTNFLMPDDAFGTHTVKLTATYNSKVWKGLGYIIARPF